MKKLVFVAIMFLAFGGAFAQESTETPELEPVVGENGEIAVKESDITGPSNFAAFSAQAAESEAPTYDNNLVYATLVGCEDIYSYCYKEFDLPAGLLDFDGGEIRVIMQHELNGHDMVRTIDLNLGCEYVNDAFGKRGRYAGRYCWGRQVGGGEYAFILGDGVPHHLFRPWNWIWISDHKVHGGNAVLGGNKIRVVTHPHVTARVLFYD